MTNANQVPQCVTLYEPIETETKIPHYNDDSDAIKRVTGSNARTYVVYSKGAFLWENPKTDLGSQIIWILRRQRNVKSEKGLFCHDKTGWRHAIYLSYCPRIQLEWSTNNL